MLAASAGIAVANIYYNQPMLGVIEADLGAEATVGFIPTATQLGYALSLVLFLPLGDVLDRRRLIVVQFVILAGAMAATAAAPSALLLVAASLLVGASATVAQQIVPLAAHLSVPARRGRSIGVVMGGLLTGILLSRTVGGFVAEQFGWRAMFWLAVPLALSAAAALRLALPPQPAQSGLSYPAALRSLAGLWREQPALRRAAFVQAALFASFSAFWTILALRLAGPPFHLGVGAAGLFGLVGVAGVLAAPLAGHLADRRGPRLVIDLGAALTFVAWIIFVAVPDVIGIGFGLILLDLGVQSALISNQHVIYALVPDGRSRLNTIFMTAMFLGGAAGSALASLAWTEGGWHAVSALGAGLGVLALALQYRGRQSGEPADMEGEAS